MSLFRCIGAIGVLALIGCKGPKEIVTEKIVTQEVIVQDTVQLQDTIVIEKDRLRVELIKLPGDTVVVEAQCAADTITVEKVVYNTEKVEKKNQTISWLYIIIIGLLILLLLSRGRVYRVID